MGLGTDEADAFVERWADTSGTEPEPYWLVMDAVGYLPPPGKPPMFREPDQVARLDAWLARVVARIG